MCGYLRDNVTQIYVSVPSFVEDGVHCSSSTMSNLAAPVVVPDRRPRGTGLTYKITVKEPSHIVVVPACLFASALDAGVRL